MTTNTTTADNTHPSNLLPSGAPPESRIGDAIQARAIYERLRQADDDGGRSAKRARVAGLLDGNPPYRASDLKAAGMDYRCNVNFRQAESYKEQAVGAFYDLYSEAPTYATVQLGKHENYSQEDLTKWSRTVTTHFDWLCRYEPSQDYMAQLSQDEMVTFGSGPMLFGDVLDWRPTSILYGQLKVPERTKSDVNLWDYCAIEMEYLVDELWSKITNEPEARTMGWNVERVKQAIILASPESQKGGLYHSWEWHQQQLKNGSINYSDTSNTISVAHVFCREFKKKGEDEGRISHFIIVRSGDQKTPDKFLFNKVGKFRTWTEAIHPMYWDRGRGGFHHSVTGMGTKMYSAMELQNRLWCDSADKAFTPKIMFKPTTSTGEDNFALQQHGQFGILAEGYDAVQTGIAGVMEEGLVFSRELTGLMASNLGQYRMDSQKSSGNPITATEAELDASKEARLNKTQMNRYYAQQDGLYAEMFRRAASHGCPDPRAHEFVKRCEQDGVPKDCLKVVEFVKASRVVGQGSEFLRQRSTEFLFGTVLPMLPEGGRTNLINDVIASRAGQSAVERYNPQKDQSTLPDDQYAWAISQVADMKIGVPAVPTDSQNPMIFASTFLQAADQAASTLEQGANPQEVAGFLNLSGQAIAIHLQRMASDPSRKQALDQMEEQFKKLAQLTDQLNEHLQEAAQQQQEEQQARQEQFAQAQSDFALKQQELQGKHQLATEKTRASLAEKRAKASQSLAINAAKSRQNMILEDARTAHQIRLDQAKAKSAAKTNEND